MFLRAEYIQTGDLCSNLPLLVNLEEEKGAFMIRMTSCHPKNKISQHMALMKSFNRNEIVSVRFPCLSFNHL